MFTLYLCVLCSTHSDRRRRHCYYTQQTTIITTDTSNVFAKKLMEIFSLRLLTDIDYFRHNICR